MKRVYLGCAITKVPPEYEVEFRSKISTIKKDLRIVGFEVIDFLSAIRQDGTEKEIYTHDIIDSVGSAEAMIAICDYPSLGLGYEMGTIIEKHGMPVLAVAHKDSIVTPLIRGITHPKFRFERYENVSDIYGMFLRFMKEG